MTGAGACGAFGAGAATRTGAGIRAAGDGAVAPGSAACGFSPGALGVKSSEEEDKGVSGKITRPIP